MINTWVRPKEWPSSTAPAHARSQPTPPPVQKDNITTSQHASLSQSLTSSIEQPCKNGTNKTEVGTKRFHMKISGSSSMSKTTGMHGLPGNLF